MKWINWNEGTLCLLQFLKKELSAKHCRLVFWQALSFAVLQFCSFAVLQWRHLIVCSICGSHPCVDKLTAQFHSSSKTLFNLLCSSHCMSLSYAINDICLECWIWFYIFETQNWSKVNVQKVPFGVLWTIQIRLTFGSQCWSMRCSIGTITQWPV